jgi:hypothetical protein
LGRATLQRANLNYGYYIGGNSLYPYSVCLRNGGKAGVHYQCAFLDAVNLRDVGMIQRSQHLGFTLKTGQPFAYRAADR